MKRQSIGLFVSCMLMVGSAATAQELSPQAVRSAVREYRQQHEVEIVRNYAELLSIPNLASDTANIRANPERISTLLQARGFKTQLLAEARNPPAGHGERPPPGATHTIHY